MKIKRREVIEWSVVIVVGATLYFTGLHTQVLGQLQRVILATGIITPDLDEPTIKANYQFMLEDFEGNKIPFDQFKGEAVFINFWATWCPPCIAEMPDIHDLYKKSGEHAAFVMISLDRDQQKARDFVTKKEFKFPVYFLASELPPVYDPSAIPTTYVISPEGEIVVTRHGMAKYDTEKFRTFLEEL
ncbi:MAG: TlpA family protein disulfide reductase [Bacteroidota bacterium]